MKPAPFEYYSPATIAEALENLDAVGYDGKVLAGGQSLIPAMNFRMARPTALVDLNGIPDLFYIKPTSEGGLAIGAMTRDTTLEYDALVTRHSPLILQAMPHVAHPQIRNRGTFGGNIAHADPSGQFPGISIAIDANLKVLKKGGERWVKAEDFFMGPFMTVIEPTELLVEVVIPPAPKRSGTSYQQVSRQRGSSAQAAVGAVVALDDRGRCNHARVVLFCVGETALLSKEASRLLIGQTPRQELFQEIGEAVQKEIDPATDLHATEEYRRHLVRVLVDKALTEAFDHAKKGG
jgi:CO/xanthine dehydrogenase FAD-binding subunit